MKEYPSIHKEINQSLNYYVFGKLDGQNIRAEWTRKNGFFKFGTRHVLLDEHDKMNPAAPSVQLIRELYQESLSKIFVNAQIPKVTAYFEYHGPNSFAGIHQPDDPMTVTLLDVDFYKQGILMPDQFLKLFEGLRIPDLLYHGKLNQPFIESVRNSTLENMPFEGVVAKAKNPKKTLMPIMCKIKSQAWLDKLKHFCRDDLEMYRRLE